MVKCKQRGRDSCSGPDSFSGLPGSESDRLQKQSKKLEQALVARKDCLSGVTDREYWEGTRIRLSSHPTGPDTPPVFSSAPHPWSGRGRSQELIYTWA